MDEVGKQDRRRISITCHMLWYQISLRHYLKFIVNCTSESERIEDHNGRGHLFITNIT